MVCVVALATVVPPAGGAPPATGARADPADDAGVAACGGDRSCLRRAETLVGDGPGALDAIIALHREYGRLEDWDGYARIARRRVEIQPSDLVSRYFLGFAEEKVHGMMTANEGAENNCDAVLRAYDAELGLL
eukprot:gene30971-14783_t